MEGVSTAPDLRCCAGSIKTDAAKTSTAGKYRPLAMSVSAVSLDRHRLTKLCAMFGSDHVGERANAAAAADKLIREAGLRWPDVILPALPSPARSRRVETVADRIEFVLNFEWLLTAWERNFLRSIRQLRYPLSPRQLEILDRLVEKAAAEARAA